MKDEIINKLDQTVSDIKAIVNDKQDPVILAQFKHDTISVVQAAVTVLLDSIKNAASGTCDLGDLSIVIDLAE